jgi:alanyl-tRNA synthetase
MRRQQTAEETRADFLAFFREHGHEIVPSDSLVPTGDPTLLFTNAGMNQFKDVFLGEGTRPYARAADTQKCLRVSGKHNDLEEVGYDTYHHTFFEMLGNWSFGDYFKKEAIRWAWDLLVGRWGLDPSRLYATVHEGDPALGLDADDEAAGYWRSETGIDPDHILYCSSADNFWMMGETGPCGPCSEVHVDLRSDEERARIDGREVVNSDDPRVIEIWNLVFIQYNAQRDGTLQPLKAKHVDTGMGFERMVAVLQSRTSTYETDLFMPILDAVAALSPRADVRGYDDLDASDDAGREKLRVALRVVADHVRTVAFAIADGVMPGNAGRGYVIRRILRRAVRFGYQTLELHEPFLYRIADTVIDLMNGQFPELERNRAYIERVVRAEEESFLETLGTGLQFFDRVMPYLRALDDGESTDTVSARLAKDRPTLDLLEKAYVNTPDRAEIMRRYVESASRGAMPGEVAFLLHDTYGFPVDLTQLMAREVGFTVDMERYEALMQEQKDRARAATSFRVDQSSTDAWATVSSGHDSEFVGYERSRVEGSVVRAVRQVRLEDGVRNELILDVTPFYAESGGQLGDTGTLLVGEEEIRVLDTQKRQGRIVHTVDRLPSDPSAPVTAEVDRGRLVRIRKHHTVTHLMHAALREILGPHVAQKGSLVAPDHLRFDFSHFERVTPDELRDVERRVNEVIQHNIERREERGVPLQDALDRGAMALFGEKYGDTVRVITFDPEYSVELCGGQHVDATGEIGVFRFTSEGSVAAGIRRVEAVAGVDAVRHLHEELDELGRVRGQFRSLQRPSDEEVAELLDRNRRLEKVLEEVRHAALASRLDAFLEDALMVGDVRLVIGQLDRVDMADLRGLGETLRAQAGNGVVGILGATDPDGSKAYLVVTVSDDLVGRGLQAGRIVGELARTVEGGGGGRPQLATAGGREPSKLPEALAGAPALIGSMLS